MSATQMQQDQSQTYACGQPYATFGSKTASTPDVRVPHHDPAAGWLQGGAPKPTAAPGRTAFPRIPEPGLLRVVIYTHFPETNPEESTTLDFQDAHLLRLMGKEGCLEYLQAAPFWRAMRPSSGPRHACRLRLLLRQVRRASTSWEVRPPDRVPRVLPEARGARRRVQLLHVLARKPVPRAPGLGLRAQASA